MRRHVCGVPRCRLCAAETALSSTIRSIEGAKMSDHFYPPFPCCGGLAFHRDDCSTRNPAPPATSDERCPRCDRANCKREERRQDHERLQSFNTEIEYQAEKAACDDEAVDWRARALDLQAQRAAAQARVAEVERDLEAARERIESLAAAHDRYHDTGMCYGDSHADFMKRIEAARGAEPQPTREELLAAVRFMVVECQQGNWRDARDRGFQVLGIDDAAAPPTSTAGEAALLEAIPPFECPRHQMSEFDRACAECMSKNTDHPAFARAALSTGGKEQG
jgi:hypothetical protein